MISVAAVERDRLRVTVRGHELYTDQPVQDGGEDTAPTPTELFVASLGACVCFYAERFLRRQGLSTEGLKVFCDYSWGEKPHRVGSVHMVVEAPGLSDTKKEAFTRVIEHCTVHNSLHTPPDVNIVVATTEREAA